MGYSESEHGSKCRKHPTQDPQPGICPFCLTESLLNLSPYELNFSHKRFTMTYSSFSFSDASSPGDYYLVLNRAASDVLGSITFTISDGLVKSRSVAGNNEAQAQNGAQTRNFVMGEKKRGFWSKLISSTGKKARGVFGHNKAMGQRGEVECYA